jgi:5-methyltetrahydropteroyltriglutamate--homocysteine methyltransferase
MAITHNLGFPRIGARRELKQALEAYWSGAINQAALREAGRRLRETHWRQQMGAGIDLIPVGDFAYYDQMLNMTALLGALPPRFGFARADLDAYFALARGTDTQPPLEMTKWFDTNYHYLVPEFRQDTVFTLDKRWLLDEIEEAQALPLRVKAVLIGPLTYLYLGKEKEPGFNRLELLPRLLAAYQALLGALKSQGVQWVQLDEPALALDLPAAWLEALTQAYAELAGAGAPQILLATYFGSVGEHAERLKALPVAGLHIDAARAPEQIELFLNDYPADKILSIGIVDGRNIWRADLDSALKNLTPAKALLSERLWIAPSCSLLHVPLDTSLETALDEEIKPWLAFAAQKLEEIAILDKGLRLGQASIAAALADCRQALRDRAASPSVRRAEVQEVLSRVAAQDYQRASPFPARIALQRERLRLPLFPTTTIGSFPQTAEIRAARSAFKRGELSEAEYQEKMRAEIRLAIRRQEEIGLDLLVHGEAERNDMVEYFGEQMAGFAFTQEGWVQSYGSRCVKPPIIYGDVASTRPLTTDWIGYAQSLTGKPVKGMLTGPVTLLQWSFARDDQPRSTTALQIALALRAEVAGLEQAGIAAIQIDEPAFREGLPLKRAHWDAYLAWAVDAFRLCSSGARDDTQIHTHMCYSEFNDILPAIAALDADVITVETSRSDMELLDAFQAFQYPNDIGPGVYDIHSPRIPQADEMLRLLHRARQVTPPERLWVNPDCGLKTRQWPEVEAALRNMVAAAKRLRQEAEPA